MITVGGLGDDIVGKETDSTSASTGPEDACLFASCVSSLRFHNPIGTQPVAGDNCLSVYGDVSNWDGNRIEADRFGEAVEESEGTVIFGNPHHYFVDLTAGTPPSQGSAFAILGVRHGIARFLFNAIDRNNCYIVEVDSEITSWLGDAGANQVPSTQTVTAKLIRRSAGVESVKDIAVHHDEPAPFGFIADSSGDALVEWTEDSVRVEILLGVHGWFLYLQDDSPTLFDGGIEFGVTLGLHEKNAKQDTLGQHIAILSRSENNIIEEGLCDIETLWFDETGFD